MEFEDFNLYMEFHLLIFCAVAEKRQVSCSELYTYIKLIK